MDELRRKIAAEIRFTTGDAILPRRRKWAADRIITMLEDGGWLKKRG